MSEDYKNKIVVTLTRTYLDKDGVARQEKMWCKSAQPVGNDMILLNTVEGRKREINRAIIESIDYPEGYEGEEEVIEDEE